jgi:hypothetical protein
MVVSRVEDNHGRGAVLEYSKLVGIDAN